MEMRLAWGEQTQARPALLRMEAVVVFQSGVLRVQRPVCCLSLLLPLPLSVVTSLFFLLLLLLCAHRESNINSDNPSSGFLFL